MIHCVAIDDEPIALSIIKEYCSRYGNILFDSFTSPVEGMNYIKSASPDIVFLDIEMNSYNGIELAKTLPAGTVLIFTTAYSQYALEGFNINAVDFLHKPIFYPRFVQAMDKAKAWLSKESVANPVKDTITLKADRKNVVITLDSVQYVEAMDNYVKVIRKDMPMVISQITMKEMEKMLPDEHFIRVHRSYFISMDYIDRFTNSRIYLRECPKPIPVGRTYNELVKKHYNLFKINNSL